jgi:nitroimidazol reductase NimA-like FMN-containing flavoprotein (pyridoxamine 5'-phosphate oxidase superfamily)
MRRKDREVTDRSEILAIMKQCDVCRIAFACDEYPYIVPMNFGLTETDGEVTLYFHSALEISSRKKISL